MSQIRKGSIVWDKQRQAFTKVLTTPGKCELPDQIVMKTGLKFHRIAKHLVLCSLPGEPVYLTHNNQPCYMVRDFQLIPQKEYLKQRVETISLSHIRENYTEFN
jgi:hypothetical protein